MKGGGEVLPILVALRKTVFKIKLMLRPIEDVRLAIRYTIFEYVIRFISPVSNLVF